MTSYALEHRIFCKNFLIPGETETRNVYRRVCRNNTGNCCSGVFFFVGQCYSYRPFQFNTIKCIYFSIYSVEALFFICSFNVIQSVFVYPITFFSLVLSFILSEKPIGLWNAQCCCSVFKKKVCFILIFFLFLVWKWYIHNCNSEWVWVWFFPRTLPSLSLNSKVFPDKDFFLIGKLTSWKHFWNVYYTTRTTSMYESPFNKKKKTY